MVEGEGKPDPKNIEIRTMRDDLAEAKKSGSVPAAPPAPGRFVKAPSPQKIGTSSQSSPQPLGLPVPSSTSGTLAPQLPPPPLPAEVVDVKKSRGKKDVVLWLLITLFVVSALAAGGVWAWIFFGKSSTDSPGREEANIVESETPLSFAEAIPSNSLMVAHYIIENEEERSQVVSAWSNVSTSSDSEILALLNGNPTALAKLPSVNEFAYVLLPGDPRYYLIVAASDEVNQYLSQYSNVQVNSISSNWLLIHSFSTDIFKESLQVGSLGSSGMQVTDGASVLTIHLYQDLLAEISPDYVLATDSSGQLVLETDLLVSNLGEPILFNAPGIVANPTAVVGRSIDKSLLKNVPDDATQVILGASLADEIERLNDPALTEKLSLFSGPFAYYKREAGGGASDVGLLVGADNAPNNAALLFPAPIVEDVLLLFLEVTGVGERPVTEFVLENGEYKGFPLRYANIEENGLALDYTFFGNLLAIATSKEGMFKAIDAELNQDVSALSTAWGPLVDGLAQNSEFFAFGYINQPAVKRIVPGGESVSALPYVVEVTRAENGVSIRAGKAVVQDLALP